MIDSKQENSLEEEPLHNWHKPEKAPCTEVFFQQHSDQANNIPECVYLDQL